MHAAVSRAVPLVRCHPLCSTRWRVAGDAPRARGSARQPSCSSRWPCGWPIICGRSQHEIGIQPPSHLGCDRSCGSHPSGSGLKGSSRRQNPAVERLVGVFRHRDSARAIGAAYLATRPEERYTDSLLRLTTYAHKDPLVIVRWATRNSALGSGGVRRMILRPARCSQRRKAAFCALTVLT